MSYQAMISKASGVTDKAMLVRIEDVMRNDIFHSTLDWQTRTQFNKGVREAMELIRYLDSPEGKAEYARYLKEWA